MTNIQQEIYERYMNSFSEEISELNTLDFDTLTRDIHDLYIKMCKVSKKEINPDFYVKRMYNIYASFTTPLDNSAYPNLSDIFFSRLDSILELNPGIKQLCELNNVKCTENEETKSKYEYDEIGYLFGNYKHKNVSNRKTRCKKCVKYVPNVRGLRYTNKTFNKLIKHFNPLNKNVSNSVYSNFQKYEKQGKVKSIRMRHLTNNKGNNISIPKGYNTMDTILKDVLRLQLSIILPNESNPSKPYVTNTTSIIVKRRMKEDFEELYKYSGYSFFAEHTNPNNSDIIIRYVINTLWPTLEKGNPTPQQETYCYAIHYLVATACPFLRGSAGFAKVMLNAALRRVGLPFVKETKLYHRKSDWVAILSPSFQDYIVDKDKLFEVDTKYKNYKSKINSRRSMNNNRTEELILMQKLNF